MALSLSQSEAVRPLLLLLCWAVLASSASCPAYAQQQVVYSWAESRAEDPRGYYPVSLLKLALSKAGDNYTAKPANHDLSQNRTLRHVELGRGLDITWTLTTPEREQLLLPIRIPIDRGLLGWRLLLINPGDADKFAQLDVEQLKQLRTGQEHDWPDFRILQHNGFSVTGTTNYQGLFHMLARGRIHYFPRALTEVLPEIAMQAEIPLAIAPRWVLYYPAPVYFFVNKERPELAAEIERGLKLAIADGSMRNLFLAHFGKTIEQMNLPAREIISLHNPLLPPATPVANADLWYDINRGF